MFVDAVADLVPAVPDPITVPNGPDGAPGGTAAADGTAGLDGASAPVATLDVERAAADQQSLDRRVAAVLDVISDAFLALGPDWRVTYANLEAARLSGTTREALVGELHWTRWPETVGSEVERQYRRAVTDRVPVVFEHYYPASGVWHDIRAYPADDGGLAVFYRDITLQKALEAERARQARELAEAHAKALAAETQFRLLVDRVRDYAVFLVDPDGIITEWGTGAERMKGYRREEIVGQHLRNLYPPGGVSEDGTAEEHMRKAMELGEYRGEGHRRRKGGGLFPANVTLTALRRDGELVGFSKITRDLTEELRRQAELAAALTRAEQAQHAAEQAQHLAESANRAKSDFLATMSHELRTPLNAIAGYTQLLQLGLRGPVTPEQYDALARVHLNQQHLLRLVNDVLTLARAEAGQLPLDLTEVPLDETLATVHVTVEPQLRTSNVGYEYHGCADPVVVRADRDKVQQVVINLLSNAAKFTPAGGRVTVRCDAGHDAEGRPVATVRVTDTGRGIPADKHDAVFQPFVQLSGGYTRTAEGTGLGLAISRDLARRMGGDLTVESEVGAGSTFTLTLPRVSGSG